MRKPNVPIVALVALVAWVAGGGAGLAQSQNCGPVGTWFGQAYLSGDPSYAGGSRWVVVISPGANEHHIQFAFEYYRVDPTFSGAFPTAVRLTGPKGAAERLLPNQYPEAAGDPDAADYPAEWLSSDAGLWKLTWVAHGLDAQSRVLYQVRTSGLARMAGCDELNIRFKLELFWPGDDVFDWSRPITQFPVIKGMTIERRVPVVF